MLPKFLPRKDDEQQRAALHKRMLRKEAEIGGKLFGAVPEGHNRQFFCLDEHTWIWHEEWLDQTGQRRAVTTRYNVRPEGVLKQQNGHSYQRLTRQEAQNLYHAAELYDQRVSSFYQRLRQVAA
jgi:hypothetical protein